MGRRIRGQARAERSVRKWNETVPVGSEVLLTKDDGTKVRTRTRSTAAMLSGHTAVIWVEGESAAWLLERVRPVSRRSSDGPEQTGECPGAALSVAEPDRLVTP